MKKYKVGSAKYNEEEFINKFAKKWNYKLMKYMGKEHKILIGWLNLEKMFRVFIRTYNWRKK